MQAGKVVARGWKSREDFFWNPRRGEKDGHFDAHQGGDKRSLTGGSVGGEW
jgi:hypothetical protein